MPADVQENPQISTRRRVTQLRINKINKSLQGILVKDFKMFLYKGQTVHLISPADRESGVNFSQALIVAGKAHIHLQGYVNKQNCRF